MLLVDLSQLVNWVFLDMEERKEMFLFHDALNTF